MKAPLQLTGLTLAAVGALAVFLRAADIPMTSPFLPANAVPAAAVPANDSGGIELHGIVPTPLGPLFSIFNTSRRISAPLVGLNETGSWGSGIGATFVVRSYRQVGEQDQVVVEYQGRPVTLTTKKSKVGVVTRGGAAPGSTPVPPALTQSVSLNPTPESEAKRLQDVADEINRRRDLRAQADATQATAPKPPVTPGGGSAP